jgi:sec-independent protein translocase protein TatC
MTDSTLPGAAKRGYRRRGRGARATEERMSLGQHLVELRKRLIISGLAIALGTVGGFIVGEQVWDYLRQPINAIADSQNASINYTGITEAFDLRVQIAFVLGILATSPIWLYQIWAFVVPALVLKEKKYALGFFFSAVPLFLAGAYLGWIIFPRTVTRRSSRRATFWTS